MKNIYKIFAFSLIVVSCSGNKTQTIEDVIATNDIVTVQKMRDQIATQQHELVDKLTKLDAKLQELNPDKNIPLITTFIAKTEPFTHYLELQGSVETKQNLVITPEMGGILNRVYVKEGQNVSKGQLLATVDDGGMGQQLAQVQIQADLAKTTFERQKRLWEQKVGSEIQFLQSKSQYEALEKSVNQINQQLAKTSIRAPFSGVIDDVITEQGSMVAPGQTPLMRIINLNDMYIETDVPEDYITTITNNKDVKVEFPVLGKSLDAKIRQTGNFINPSNRTFKIEIAVPNKDQSIKPNLTARLKINDYTNEKALLIPQSIISENAEGEQYIYVLKDKVENKATAHQIIITTGKTQGNVIEVLSGLENNTEVVKEGARSVKDGLSVKITN